ncbi:aldehyde dehydrogenase family protein [Cupriavidus plantarum]|uniref:aldehyde dehydrogenase (NAD(+)) n=1 Tax=Cupriavidus plantarum TaxID=942865 RepID=A0A316ERX8_9BURK|nr:aldehyde dehydrogenase family protein [Cupriavidus plantarum]PWK33882.1 aldehyde dehydrogenase (NAD+) [Cupriavidus plantarum]
MHTIDKIYINGAFVTPHGEEWFDLYNPATEQTIGRVRLADEADANAAIAAARAALPRIASASREERLAWLSRMETAVRKREAELFDAVIEEYGAPVSRARWMVDYAADVIAHTADVLRDYPFTRRAGTAEVTMTPVGVAGLITPWNANASFITGKLATALAAGCPAVIKPSEMSALQTRIVTEALHEAGLPPGAFHIVTGRGDVVGAAITAHADVAKISFTGSTAVGKAIVRAGADTLKRVTLELGGKSPTIVLDDADFAKVVPMALQAGFMNSGQACIAGTRILVPEARKEEFEAHVRDAIHQFPAGLPSDPTTAIGPMVSQRQWERVQRYIALGLEQGARLVAGGPGRPDGLSAGWFVRPTVFTDVRNDMTIAREEIFGPVLSILTYRDEDEAIAIANDTTYGLSAYVMGADGERARRHAARIAARIESGRVLVNTLAHEPKAPFGGFKQSGLGREYGTFGLEAFLEPKSTLGVFAD